MADPSPQVLVCGLSDGDYAWGAVLRALKARGATPWLLRTDRFPDEVSLSWTGSGEGRLHFHDRGQTLALSDLTAIWMRRNAAGRGLPDTLPPPVRRAAGREVRALLEGALLDTDALIVDPPAVYAHGRHKALQIALATHHGLHVPATLETHDPDEARAFVAAVDGEVVAKMHQDVRLRDNTVFTTKLSPDDLAALDSLASCPMILQEAVDKVAEVRVVTLGLQQFAVRLDLTHLSGEARVDWRRQGADTLHLWEPVDLPAEVARGLRGLTDDLGTNYGSADFLIAPDGRWMFLENNVVGESFWIDAHHPVSDTLADVLLGHLPHRPCPPELR